MPDLEVYKKPDIQSLLMQFSSTVSATVESFLQDSLSVCHLKALKNLYNERRPRNITETESGNVTID